MSANDITTEARAKLEALRGEYRAGEAMLTDLEQRRAQLRETMLRISGAIQSLEELLGEDTASQTDADSILIPAEDRVV